VSANSLSECCTGTGTYLCPDNSYPVGVVWSGGPGEEATLCWY